MKLSKNQMILIAAGIVVLIIVGMFIGYYNSFVTLDQGVKSQWSLVENQYQRQSDLIPNLISTTSSIVKVETKFVKDVTDARTKWQTSTSLYDKDLSGAQMNNAITALVSAVATTENYPTLRATEEYKTLTDELIGAQNRISTEEDAT